jgi:hypothetical protein
MVVPSHDLDQVQRWMQAVIMHPSGVVGGINSEGARREIDVSADQAEAVICRSQNQTPIERLQVYANAYYARLLECLRQEFPALAHAVGEDTFNGFGLGYLQAYPSRSYTLANLGRHFPRFLAETRPADTIAPDGSPRWPDFLIDLATLERTYSEVFDGPGIEGERVLQAEDLLAIPKDRWPDVRLIPVPCLRLLVLRYPVHEYISAVRAKAEAVVPEPSPTYLVVTRRQFVVRRCAVSPVEYSLLADLVGGATLGTAIESVASHPDADAESLPTMLQTWFQQWASAAFFHAADITP